MSSIRHWVGEYVTLRATFKDDAGTLTDPTTVTFRVKPPGGTVTTYTLADLTLIRNSVGVFSKSVLLTASGNWQWEAEAEGAVDKIERHMFFVASTGISS